MAGEKGAGWGSPSVCPLPSPALCGHGMGQKLSSPCPPRFGRPATGRQGWVVTRACLEPSQGDVWSSVGFTLAYVNTVFNVMGGPWLEMEVWVWWGFPYSSAPCLSCTEILSQSNCLGRTPVSSGGQHGWGLGMDRDSCLTCWDPGSVTTMWPWSRCFTFLSLSIHTCKMGLDACPASHWVCSQHP